MLKIDSIASFLYGITETLHEHFYRFPKGKFSKLEKQQLYVSRRTSLGNGIERDLRYGCLFHLSSMICVDVFALEMSMHLGMAVAMQQQERILRCYFVQHRIPPQMQQLQSQPYWRILVAPIFLQQQQTGAFVRYCCYCCCASKWLVFSYASDISATRTKFR